ncbi:MAG: TonB-dependent receptor [Gammaproteobacteria bacterium]
MSIRRMSSLPLIAAAVASALGTVWTAPVFGQAALEEVVVTARRREEGLQDVPISINAVSGDKLEEAGIDKLEDLQALVPNFQLTETGISTQMYVRGIGTSNNQGFEQSVGTYVDGVYYGRQQLIRAPMFDLARVEVLRGPQAILFGKNSIAGALNMTTARPTDERMGKVAVTLNPDFGGYESRFIYSQGITDNLAGRLSLRFAEEDGYVRNTRRNDDEVNRKEATVRGQLRFTPTDTQEWNLKVEWNQFDQTGRQIEVIQDDATAESDGLSFGQILAGFGQPLGIAELNIDYERQADSFEKSDNELINFTLIGTFDYENGNALTSTTSYVEYTFDEICDCDFVGAPVFDLPMNEGYEQISQEFRLASAGGELIDWQTGLFFQRSDVLFQDMLRVQSNSILPQISSLLGNVINQGAARSYESSSELYAFFTEATINVSDRFRVTVGGRYTKEHKSGSRIAQVYDLQPGSLERLGLSTNAAAPALFDLVFGFQNEQFEGHNLRGSRSEDSFTPSLNMQYDINDDWMGYITASTGFKSGGFDARGNNTNSFEFEEEDATAIEIGAKGKFADGRVEANISAYNTRYSDLQVSQFDGQIGFNVGNAGEVVARGIELDGRWAIADSWTSTFSVAYLDHEFGDFRNGNCYNFQEQDGDFVDGVQLCDYTGLSGQYTPRLTGAFSLDYYKPLNGSFDLRMTADMSYTAEQNVHVNLDPQYEIDAYAKWNIRVALESDNWTLALSGLNLSDERVLTYVGNNPLSGSTFNTNTFYGFVAPPRTFTLSAIYEF